MQNEGSSANSLRIFVGRLPQRTTEAELRTHFSGCGTVTEVDMLMRRSNGRFKGAAFVHFESAACAASALALDGQEINGKAAAVQPADADGAVARTDAATAPAGETSASAVDPPAGIASVFVGNLPEGVSEKAVRKVQRNPLTLPPPCRLHSHCLNAR
jgi:RNA recognition motif-containing protein